MYCIYQQSGVDNEWLASECSVALTILEDNTMLGFLHMS